GRPAAGPAAADHVDPGRGRPGHAAGHGHRPLRPCTRAQAQAHRRARGRLRAGARGARGAPGRVDRGGRQPGVHRGRARAPGPGAAGKRREAAGAAVAARPRGGPRRFPAPAAVRRRRERAGAGGNGGAVRPLRRGEHQARQVRRPDRGAGQRGARAGGGPEGHGREHGGQQLGDGAGLRGRPALRRGRPGRTAGAAPGPRTGRALRQRRDPLRRHGLGDGGMRTKAGGVLRNAVLPALLAACGLFAAGAAARDDVAAAGVEEAPAGDDAGDGSGPVIGLDRARVDAWLDGLVPYLMARGDLAGAVVTVVEDGRVVTERGFGYADVAGRSPVDPETTLFRPGSVSKLFTWTAVMQLVEQGRLDLDTDINTYLDFQVPAKGEPITLRHIMTHTSGLEERLRHLIVLGPDHPDDADRFRRDHVPAQIFPPGTRPAYSNY